MGRDSMIAETLNNTVGNVLCEAPTGWRHRATVAIVAGVNRHASFHLMGASKPVQCSPVDIPTVPIYAGGWMRLVNGRSVSATDGQLQPARHWGAGIVFICVRPGQSGPVACEVSPCRRQSTGWRRYFDPRGETCSERSATAASYLQRRCDLRRMGF
jgi:hypothetical protein